MPRAPSVGWHAGARAWTSAVGEVGKNGRRKPVYFREIPYGPRNSANHRRAQDALKAFLDARDSRRERGATSRSTSAPRRTCSGSRPGSTAAWPGRSRSADT